MKLTIARKFRKFSLGSLLVMLLLILYLPMKSIEAPAPAKKAIEYGWNAPTPDFYAKHVKEMERRPFDGVMMKLNAGKEVFKKTAYPNTAFERDRQDLAATKSSRLTDNFVVMWSGMDEGWDWFDNADWATAEKNIRNFAKTSRAGRFRGIAFDSEPYTNSPWNYTKQPNRQTKSFSAYQQQVRKRGAQFINALQSEQPGTQVLTFALLSWLKDLWLAPPNDAAKLQQKLAVDAYGLWPDFVNGMLDAAQPGSVIIDGHEWAYYFSGAGAFDKTRNQIFKQARLLVDPANYDKYDLHVKMGQAVYSDLLLDEFPTGTKDSRYGKTMPHFLSTNDRLRLLEHNLYHSLRTSDRYAWIYSESADWWKNKIPKGSEAAMLRAKTKINKGQSLGFNLDPAIAKAMKKCRDINKQCQST
jgi:hypothetical protein